MPVWPPKFVIDQKSILNLFTGETFYSNVDASIREAILNAVDAIGRRQDIEEDISPQIGVIFDRQSMTITVTDNGDGMGKEQILDLFTTIGASASRVSSEFQNNKYTAIGEFGIGVLSYFLICDRFQIHTKRNGEEPIGLEFSRSMLDATSPAKVIKPHKNEIGTELALSVEKEEHFDFLLEKFPHWIRNVEGLTAKKNPGGELLNQGGLSREIKPIEVINKPSWIDMAQIGPPELLDQWDTFDGAAHVDILYRGVFVDKLEVSQLWAIAGAIHVDPKHFRPKLNREGFVGEKLQAELEPILRASHPKVLERAIECVKEIFESNVTKQWSLDRWITLWLAVPRTGQYENAAKIWDDEFRRRKAFKLLCSEGKVRDVSVQDLEGLKQNQIYVVPDNLRKANLVTQQAVRVLRDSHNIVVQGISRDSHYMKKTSLVGASTRDLLLNHFQKSLPKLIQVQDIASSVISQESAVSMFEDPPGVKLVHLGADATAIIPVGQEVWINIDCDVGKQIVEDTCTRNEGHVGLYISCLKHFDIQGARDYANQIISVLAKCPEEPNKLGPIKRQFLKGLIR